MKLEKVYLYLWLSLLLIVGLTFINLSIFFEVRRMEEEYLHKLAYLHFTNYVNNQQYRGDQQVLINPDRTENLKVFVFEDPIRPFQTVKVGIRQELIQNRMDTLMKRLLFLEFVLVFTLVFLYQAVIEGYLKKLSSKEEWVRRLMLSLTHRLGNFMSTQKVLLTLLKKDHPHDKNVDRMERSILRADRDFSIFLNLIKEVRDIKPEILDVKHMIEESLRYFEDERGKKTILVNLTSMKVRMDRADLEDVLYNLIGNALKHSKSFVQVRVCPSRSMLVIRNDYSSFTNHGMGLGIELTRKVLERYGFELIMRLKKDYTVFVIFKGKD